MVTKRGLANDPELLEFEKRRKLKAEADHSFGPDSAVLQLANEHYTVGWICAISTEYVAARCFLDMEHDRPEHQSPHDNNDYTLGNIGKHNVVIAVLPDGEYGLASAASVARDMLHSFPNIRIGLMVGVGGGAPSGTHDIRLGDVVVSAPRDGRGGVLQYDFGKTIQDQGFHITGFLDQPPTILRTAVSGLRAKYESDGNRLQEAVDVVLDKNPRLRKKYSKPPNSSDRLYQSDTLHNEGVCCGDNTNDDTPGVVPRHVRSGDDDSPSIHYGLIASANQLMRDASMRDRLSKDEGVFCFEMEAAGLMNHFPCLVIRGICDYSDTHKNKTWQGYAAMTGSAYAKALLCRIPPSKVAAEQKLSEVLLGIHENITSLVCRQHDQEESAILDWLTPIEYISQQNDNARRRQPGTGQWLLESAEYQNWLNAENETLFCPGIPGAGKTILTSTVVGDLHRRFGTDTAVGLAYVYLNFQRVHEQRVDNLMLSLLKQLARDRPSLPASVKELHNGHRKRRTRPALNDISEVLRSVATAYSKVFIVVDALDECKSLTAVDRDSCPKFSIYNKGPINRSSLEIRASEEDVNRYLETNLTRLPRFVSRNPELQKEIKKSITDSVNGMFLLAQLHFDLLVGIDTPKAMLNILRNLVSGSNAYDSAYGDAMRRIEEQGRHQERRAKQVLTWITCATKPLSTLELQHALAVETGQPELDTANLSDIEDVVSVCAGLVTVDKDSGIIRLVHYTTQQYFERTQSTWFPDAQAELMMACITYLSFECFEEDFPETNVDLQSRCRLHPLYEYAAKNWGHHARLQMSCQAVLSFLEKDAQVEASSQLLLAENLWNSNYLYNSPKQVTGIHIASYFGLVEAVKVMAQSHNINVTDSFSRTPLWYATEQGHEGVIELLLKEGANTEIKDNEFCRTPLWWPLERNKLPLVKLLLKAGADVEAVDYVDRTPLAYAVFKGQDTIVRLLLEKGAKVEPKSDYRSTPLMNAVQKGYSTIVGLLLDAGADTEAQDQFGRVPISYAAERGHEVIVQLLLDKGADIETKDRPYGRTPMLWAAERSHHDIVRALLERGADTETVDKNGRTLLMEAAATGRTELAKLLFQYGAHVDAKGDIGQTPLFSAAMAGHVTMVRLLLENGANVNDRNKNGRTFLFEVVEEGNIDLVKLFLEHNADVKSEDENAQTQSFATVVRGNIEIFSLLFKHGADVNIKDKLGRTLLSEAAKHGHVTLMKILLEHGAEVDSKDSSGRTSLSGAAMGGFIETTKTLLEHGADVNARDENGWTPLLEATEKGNLAIIKILLEYGADVNARNHCGRTSIMGATYGGHAAVVEILLEYGADFQAQDDHGDTPLLIAANRTLKAIMIPLLEKGAMFRSEDLQSLQDPLLISWAAEKGYEAIARMLVDIGVDTEVIDWRGRRPLSKAAEKGYEAIVGVLLDNGADIQALDRGGRGPLSYAAEKGHWGIVCTLLGNGAKVDAAECYSRRTPLSYAAEAGHTAIAQVLLENGAMLESKSRDGRTPLLYAAGERHESLVRFLLENGADLVTKHH